jgi:hypothetical protein
MVKTALMGLLGVDPSGTAGERSDRSNRDTLATLLAGLACMGGLIHIGAAVDHADELPLYVLLFLSLAAAQLTWAALILRNATDRLLRCGCLLNTTVIGLWALSRTTGVPIAEHPWVPEPVGIADLVETVGETVVLIVAWSLVAAPRLRFARMLSERVAVPVVAMLVLSALFGVGAHAG